MSNTRKLAWYLLGGSVVGVIGALPVPTNRKDTRRNPTSNRNAQAGETGRGQ
jgi:hypothetical protein